MFSDARFPVHQLTLAPGDSLLLYTDGLTESRNGEGAEYGLKRIRALAAQHTCVKPADLISKCLEDLLTFGAGSKQTDDLTLLALRRAA
jgi:sigma-B regulation protein RsbU (phosphoserine phosphatase)